MPKKIVICPQKDAVCAAKFIRKMRGGSQSSLIETEDGNYYIVKLMQNPQGTEILLNEVLGTEIMKLVGLKTPNWSPIWISERFIEDNPALWYESANSGRRRPPPGLHFGSKLILPKANEDIYEVLPRSWFSRILHREDFIGMLLFDLWANQRDNRQAIFLQNQESHSIEVTYIDHGCLFGPEDTAKPAKRIRPMYMDPAIYSNIDLEATLPHWEARIRTLSESVLSSLINRLSIPAQWYTPQDINRIVSGLVTRRALLGKYADLIRATLKNLRIDMLVEPPDELQICGARLCTDSYRRIRLALPRVG